MGMIRLEELNNIIAETLYVGEGNQRRENENFWHDLARKKFDSYCGTLLSELHKCDSDMQDRKEVERLARLLEWEGDIVLSDMLCYIAEEIQQA